MIRWDADHESTAETPDLAALAALLADRTRAAICIALLDGGTWTAGELAEYAGVAPSTATEHLNLLVAGGLLAEERRGRRRHLRLAGPDTAETLENLAGLAPYRRVRIRSLAEANHRRALHHARTCYDHIAGALGVALAEAMTERGLLVRENGVELTGAGAAWLAALGIPHGGHSPAHRAHVRTCLDWTSRRRHLSGAVGAALYRHALEQRWIIKAPAGRILAVTEAGRAAFQRELGLPAEVLAPAPAAPPAPDRTDITPRRPG
ncbi:winged helix-turn-helix domain-containing protein [Streptomyces sp. RS10V-4]|uniref:winged helix-turn-helix domain-containing protein n=1 Tax=Streptomyces rhizoryzae TaxID=2932493 RepID=UPI002005F0FD|nr:winged helix-turn-helix domain-containing protein [Streptomyces rhizoryzae]MCK7622057.1 winged helix-turn-helix domain-containing protein [Streptomyces rhizoryzae]